MLELNNRLVKAIEEQIPRKKDQQVFLQKIIPLGKESIYRRLRGEILFSFSEACIIAEKLKISLDNLVKTDNISTPSFLLELPIALNPLENVAFKLFQHEESFAEFMKFPDLIIKSVFSFIPYSLFLPFEGLFNFKMYQYLYQLDIKNIPEKYSDFSLSADINARRISLAEKALFMPKDITIIDRKIFTYLVDEINFFHSMGLLSIIDKHQLKDEMLQLLHHFECLTSYGIRKTGNIETMIYLSNTNIYQSYTYVKGVDFACSYMDGIYSMNTMLSRDPDVCKMHEGWIESLKRFSSLISISGEIERRAFFSQQKRLIEETLC